MIRLALVSVLSFLVFWMPLYGEKPSKSWEGKSMIVLPLPNSSRWVHASVGQRQYTARLSTDRLFRTLDPEPVKVRRVDEKDGNTELTLESRHLGTGKITFLETTDWPAEAWHEMVAVLAERDDLEKNDRFVANSNSKVLHFRGCNHLPHPDSGVRFPSISEARSSGYTLCTLCFKRFPRYSGFDVEQNIAAFQATAARNLGPPDMNATTQETLQRVGKKVIENWPSPLRGYNYRFVVLDSPLPNAVAVADGQIYMTSSLFNSLENEAEIEAVLAHEVAHVEMRHSWRHFRAARKASLWSALAIGVTAALTKSRNATEVAATLSNIASSIVLTGYGRDMEEEADSFAGIYFEHQGNVYGPQSMVQVLSKLLYAGELTGADPDGGGGLFASHPDLPDRIQKVRHTTADVAPDVSFEGLDKDEEVVATVRFQWQRHYPRLGSIDGGYEMISLIDTTPALGEKAKVKDIKIRTESEWLKLDNKEDMEIEPGESVGAAFVSKSHQQLVREINGLELELGGVTTWRRAVEPLAGKRTGNTDWGTREPATAVATQVAAQAHPTVGESNLESAEARSQPTEGAAAELKVVGSESTSLDDTGTATGPAVATSEVASPGNPTWPASSAFTPEAAVREPRPTGPVNPEEPTDRFSEPSTPEAPSAQASALEVEESVTPPTITPAEPVSTPALNALTSPETSPSDHGAEEHHPTAGPQQPQSVFHEVTPGLGEAATSPYDAKKQLQDGASRAVDDRAKPSHPLARVRPPKAGAYFVQVGAFRHSDQTADLMSQLSGKGYSSLVLPGSDYFRVLVGPLISEADALATKAKLEQDGFAGYIRNDVRIP